jgi:hypothetical protein
MVSGKTFFEGGIADIRYIVHGVIDFSSAIPSHRFCGHLP